MKDCNTLSNIDGIAENIWIVSELRELAKKNKRGIALIFLDVSKAFDSIGHLITQQAAERLGFPKDIRKYCVILLLRTGVRMHTEIQREWRNKTR